MIDADIREACGDGTLCLNVGTMLDDEEGGVPCQIARFPTGQVARGSTIYFVLEALCSDDPETRPLVSPADSPAADLTASGRLHMLKIAGSIVAPTTLLTSLLFYFGFLYTHWFYDYFG